MVPHTFTMLRWSVAGTFTTWVCQCNLLRRRRRACDQDALACGVTCWCCDLWGNRKCCEGSAVKAKGNFGCNGDIEDSKITMICFELDVYVRLAGTCWRMATVLWSSLIPFCEQNLIGHWAPNFLVGLGERPQTTKLIRCLTSAYSPAFTVMHVEMESSSMFFSFYEFCFHKPFSFLEKKKNDLCQV